MLLKVEDSGRGNVWREIRKKGAIGHVTMAPWVLDHRFCKP